MKMAIGYEINNDVYVMWQFSCKNICSTCTYRWKSLNAYMFYKLYSVGHTIETTVENTT